MAAATYAHMALQIAVIKPMRVLVTIVSCIMSPINLKFLRHSDFK